MNKWKVAVYLRLSIDDGDKMESNSITNQKKIINSYIKKEKNLSIKDYYIDDGYSGTSFDRPEFQRMIADIKNDKIDTIIVKDLSRLGRNYIEVGRYIEEFFPENNIRFIAINDNIDSYKDPKSINNVIVPFKNLLNDEYARDISNKIRSVLDTKRENGEFIGSHAPYGYLRDERNKHKFIIDKKASKIVKKIFNMILNGKSRQEVIDDLNKLNILPPAVYKMKEHNIKQKTSDKMYHWDRKKIDAILTNQEYTGDLIQGKMQRISHKVHKIVKIEKEKWIVVPNHHVAIITKDEFNQVQNILYNRDTKINKNNQFNIFSGHLKCEDCGCNLSMVKPKGKVYYYCTSYMRHKECTSHSITKEKIEKAVLEIINKQIELMVDVEERINEIAKKENINYDLEILKGRLEDVEESLSRYNLFKRSALADYESNFISREDYEEYNLEYSKKMKQLLKSKEKIENEIKKMGNVPQKENNILDKYNKKIENLDKTIIDELIEYIYISEDKTIRIVFKYEDEYNSAIDFIKKHNCDIIDENYSENIYEEVI